ncbi:MAG: SRPBCC domain-containing protein [Devosia sp.]
MHALNKTVARSSVRVERDYAATPETVFEAWLDQALVARWMAPGFTEAHAQIEPRLSGHYRVVQSIDGRPIGGFDATIIEFDRPKRLVFAWGMLGADGDQGQHFDSRLTIILSAVPNGTRLLLIHEELDDFAAAMPDVAALIETGWKDVLNKLAGVLQ